ncbi:GTP pyrophosphokinase [Microbacterium sp. E-13]|uniref:GTP pyrophosphokinase n=1 Tax=Microbacterium sp. E-13 TaxID=3404048 RepID=UPI003CECB0C5
MADTARELYDNYAALHSNYQAQARELEVRLAGCIGERGILKASVSSRAKEPLELFKKQLRKRYTDPWSECSDIVGARVVVGTTSERSEVVASLQASKLFEVIEIENQEAESNPSEIRYRGLHVHVISDIVRRPDGTPMQCEIQVRTAAQHAWAETEHRYVYKKGEVPHTVKRHFNRLLVLMELFDLELEEGVKMARELDGFRRLELSHHLEVAVNQLTDVPGDEHLTMAAIEELESAGLGSAVELRAIVDVYLRDKRDELRRVVEEHGPNSDSHDVSSGWILTQGELILLLALLDKDEYQLSNALQHSDLFAPAETLALATGHMGFLRG